ncbi:MAG: hypothetical protein AAF962_20145 [Actinomycetota bacterium]
MLVWFAVVAMVLVAEIFQSPMVDYRMVALGAVLPLIEVLIGRPIFLHTLAAPVLLLCVVMAATTGRRLVRRRFLGLPIGLFLHLVLDATWANTKLFWWPALGFDLGGEQTPEQANGLVVAVLLELVGIAVAVWAYRRYGLARPDLRRRFLTTGQLDRSVLSS